MVGPSLSAHHVTCGSLMTSARHPRLHRTRDAVVLVGVCLAGLAVWLLYVAVQPRDYALPHGSVDRLDTLLGWRAPGINPRDLVERDRLWLAMAGWLVIALVAGRLRPRLWALIGPAVVLPALVLFFDTAPHDAQGWWELNVAYLPVLGALASAAAFIGGTVDGLFQSPVVFGFVVGVLAVGALLMGGGESMSVISLASVAMATLAAAVALAVRELGPPV